MRFQTVRVLHSPNIWAKLPVLEVLVDVGEFTGRPPADVLRVWERIQAWFPQLNGRRCQSGECAAFPNPAQQGAFFAQLLERVAAEMQLLAGSNCGFSRTRPTARPDVFQVLVAFSEDAVVKAAIETARNICLAALEDTSVDVVEEVDKLRSLDQQIRLGPSTGAIVHAAEARGIPYRRLNEGSLVQLGYGIRQHRILAAETDRTSAIAETIAQDKELTKSLLRAIGVPVPEGRPVESPEDAWDAADDIGVPVVVKPQYGNHGRGVAVNLTTAEQVKAAYLAAKDEGSAVIVERFAPGFDHRMLVVGDRLIAAARREPPQITGDGRSTIEELVAEVNQDPRRGEGHATTLSKLRLDAIALAVLAEESLTPQSVLPVGTVLAIRRNANLSTGGSANDVTDLVHPEVAARAIDAARIIGLDIAGVDMVAVDISRPLEEQGGVVVEVNAGPGLRMHLEPSSGKPRAVGEAIVATLFCEGDDGRIPLAGVAGLDGDSTTARCLAHILEGTGQRVGLACATGTYANEHQIETGDCCGPKGSRLVLLNPQVEAAVLETSPKSIINDGLGFDLCSVAVVTQVGNCNSAGCSPEDTAASFQVLIESVSTTGTAILNADDPRVPPLAAHCAGGILFTSKDRSNPLLAAHRVRRGRVAFLDGDVLVLAEGDREIRVAALEDLPLTQGRPSSCQVDQALACAAAAWMLNIAEELIRTRLKSFEVERLESGSHAANGSAAWEGNGASPNGHVVAPLAPVGEKLGSN